MLEIGGGFNRASGCGVSGMAVVFRSKVGPFLARVCSLLLLDGTGTKTPFAGCGFLRRSGTSHDAAVPAVIADAGDVHIADVSIVDIGVVNHGPVHVHDGGVVAEITAIPAPPVEALAVVAVAVVDASVEAYLRAPIAGVPSVAAVIPSPIAGGPEQAYGGGHDPRSGDPVVAAGIGIPGPVAGRPQVVGSRTDRLRIDGQLWRGDVDCYSDRHLRKGRAGQHTKDRDQEEMSHPEIANPSQNLHISTFGRWLSACERIGKAAERSALSLFR